MYIFKKNRNFEIESNMMFIFGVAFYATERKFSRIVLTPLSLTCVPSVKLANDLFAENCNDIFKVLLAHLLQSSVMGQTKQ